MTQESLNGGTRLSVETLFTTLGLNLSSSDKKNLDFAKAFNVLGVAFDLNINPDDSFMIRNTESRVSDLVSRISEVLEKGKLNAKDATGLRSRLNFACAQLYGRTAASVLKDFGKYETSKFPRKLEHNTRILLEIMISHLENGMPRTVHFDDADPVHIFTDGSREGDGESGRAAGLGAVLVNSDGECLQALSFTPNEEQVKDLGNGIHQLEILPVTMACIAFEEHVCRPAYFHVDNTAAQSALINVGSSNHSSRSLVYLYLDLEQRLQLRPWISRIGSVSNIADGPSRGWFGEVEGLGAKCFEFPEKVLFYVLEDFKKKRGSLAMSNA